GPTYRPPSPSHCDQSAQQAICEYVPRRSRRLPQAQLPANLFADRRSYSPPVDTRYRQLVASPTSGDLFILAKDLFVAASVITIDTSPTSNSWRGPVRSLSTGFAEGEFTEGHELDRKWRVPKEMIGRRLSQEEARRLLAKFE